MKFLVYFWLLVFGILSLAPNMQGSQYLKIGQMIQHYENHYAEKNKSIDNFFTFLSEHYSTNRDLENHCHKNLPFKSISTSPILLSINEIKIQPVFVCHLKSENKDKLYSYAHFTDSQKLAAIWNPPRV